MDAPAGFSTHLHREATEAARGGHSRAAFHEGMTTTAPHSPRHPAIRWAAAGALACLSTAALCGALVLAVAPTASDRALTTGVLLAATGTAVVLTAMRAWWTGTPVLPHRAAGARSRGAAPQLCEAPARSGRLARSDRRAATPSPSGTSSPAAVGAARPAGRSASVVPQRATERLRLSGDSAVRSARPMKDRATVPAEPAA